jgi:predicted dienelactone hydrolase
MTLTRRLALFGAACAALIRLPTATAMAKDADDRTFIETYTTPDGRSVSVRVLAPRSGKQWEMIAFSHGANSRSTLYERILQPWRQAGWLVLAPDHLDAGGAPDRTKVSAEQLTASRVADIRAIIDQRAVAEAIAARFGASIDWDGVVVAGHSYGGITAQSVAGAKTLTRGERSGARQPQNNFDPAVKAVIAFSPPGPITGFIPEDAWSDMTVPALVETGTADVLPGFIDDWHAHAASFHNAPAGDKWLLVGSGVDHYFGGLICRLREGNDSQSAALDATVKISLEFLDAYGRRDPAALQRLSGAARNQSFTPLVSITQG